MAWKRKFTMEVNGQFLSAAENKQWLTQNATLYEKHQGMDWKRRVSDMFGRIDPLFSKSTNWMSQSMWFIEFINRRSITNHEWVNNAEEYHQARNFNTTNINAEVSTELEQPNSYKWVINYSDRIWILVKINLRKTNVMLSVDDHLSRWTSSW